MSLTCSATSCLVLPFLVLSCLVMSCHAMSCHVMSCLALSYFVLFRLVMSCHVLPCLVMSCHVLSCHPTSLCSASELNPLISALSRTQHILITASHIACYFIYLSCVMSLYSILAHKSYSTLFIHLNLTFPFHFFSSLFLFMF